MTELTDDDKGKKVVNAAGDTIGRVSGVRGGRAYVDPDTGLTDSIMAALGWSDIDEDDYAVDEDQIDTVTDDEIRLTR
ncbi:PRC-barrel domain containing protein [Haloarculaceae archaeon H-GB2-1]|nr:PRC-barrel domain containing protein [Haloarculaceae archaeon H-GB1-1]MEA5389494.1 PRC-barrel domain containing protein [Haloarculaceae archaeon H-GB11]MEA5410052.1 PRC-barrel domain containing protein [Haloarculaceae archaeon H-GB2-1]